MNAEGSNTSIRYEDNASSAVERPESETSTFVDSVDIKGDDQMTGMPETEATNGEPKTEQELLFCKFCDFQAKDLAKYVNHVVRPSHIKKAADGYNIRLTKEGDGPPKIFHCQTCVIACNGENAWNQHLLGQKHRKVLEKKSSDLAAEKQIQTQPFYGGGGGGGGGPMKTNHYGNAHYKKPYEKVHRTVQQPSHIPSQALGSRDFANYAEPLIGLEYVTEVQVIGQSPRYQCSLCDSKFDHNLKFPHLVGAKHRMNVLKIKRPDFLKNPENRTQKRSELTAMLLREAQRLEQEEGRQQVKTKVEKSPFISVNSNVQTGYQGSGNQGSGYQGSGYQGSGYQGSGYQGAKRGQTGRGGFTRGGTTPRGNRGTRGGRGTSPRGSRGNRGSYRGRGGQSSWSEPQGDYSSSFSQPTAYNHNNQPYNASYDSYNRSSGYDNYNQQASGGTSNYMYPLEPFSTTTQERLLPPPQIRPPAANVNPTVQPTSIEDQNKPDLSIGLAGALGDLTKLVQNEDDASVALHVSNALTQALLQFRMTGIQDENAT